MTESNASEEPDPVQAVTILNALSAWCAAAPGRRFSVAFTESGWSAALDERRASTGATLADAMAQIASVAAMEVTPQPSTDISD